MSTHLQLFLIAFLFLIFIVIIYMLKNKRLNLKYSLLWLFSLVSMIVLAIFPNIINTVSLALGIYDPVNTVFFVAIFFILLILLSIMSIVSKMTSTIYTLTQRLAIIENELNDLKNSIKAEAHHADCN